ncbi:MAG: zinc-dependent metalloprotease [Bacteroidota bacterium]
MKHLCFTLLLFMSGITLFGQEKGLPTIEDRTKGLETYTGYFPFFWDETEGKVLLEISRMGEDFLYVHSLAAGVGSNDIGLDRGQLGGERVVRFERSGPKVLLIQKNLSFRAQSDNDAEQESVEQAFAQSILAGFKIAAQSGDRVLIDLEPLLMQDMHNVVGALGRSKQGDYKMDKDRSAVYLPRCKSFPENTEFEAWLTFGGKPKGSYVRDVVPAPNSISVRQHHSFVKLPDDQYQVRLADPRAGYITNSFKDYASPIGSPLRKSFILRHRLHKKDPSAKKSEPIEPIVYYVDRGAPEPVRSALIEGASWWNQAFEAAGYIDAFQVKVLPEDADPMDVRYNLIQWVHRSTRGWSYGGSVADPRTGEIIKGHVSLGSLRVRQDFLIAQGLIGPYERGEDPDPRMLEMALARLRQLSAHEVGHTIGLMHNFAASVNDRASVMDYPHPFARLRNNGKMDFGQAYGVGIGEWDKRAIIWGYQHFPAKTDEATALNDIMRKTHKLGLHFLSDPDARPVGSAHPLAHLWDNGKDAIAELERLMEIRAKVLTDFSEEQIPLGQPMASLEEVLVPIYFSHRYQVEAVAKILGGMSYTYKLRGDEQAGPNIIPAERQQAALTALLHSLDPSILAMPQHILDLVPPRPPGYRRDRESFKIRTGANLDPFAAAEAASNHSLRYLLDPHRAARLLEFSARNAEMPSLSDVIDRLMAMSWKAKTADAYEQEILFVVQQQSLQHLITLAMHKDASASVKSIARFKLQALMKWLEEQEVEGRAAAQHAMAIDLIDQFLDDPEEVKLPKLLPMPDGSPIGCGE